MSFHKKTIKDIDVSGKTVLLSVDYNVPLEDGKITDDYRIKQSLPTLEYLISQSCKVIIISHLGRPKGKPEPDLSLQPVAKRLSELLSKEVQFNPDCVGVSVKKTIAKMMAGSVMLLENTRFHREEEKNDNGFARALASLGEIFVQEAFGNAHREHASTVGVAKHLPAVAGLLLAKEVETITAVMANPKRPFVCIMGGAKVADKIDTLDNFVRSADTVILGGAIANTFLKSMGYEIGKSVHDEEDEEIVKRVQADANKRIGKNPDELLWLPKADVAVGKSIDESEPRKEIPTRSVEGDDYILDLGTESIEEVIAKIKLAGTVVWSGTLGITEIPQFAEGSNKVAEAIAQSGATSIIGGGDTAGFVLGLPVKIGQSITHISSGGSAALELMAGHKLPAVEALQNRD